MIFLSDPADGRFRLKTPGRLLIALLLIPLGLEGCRTDDQEIPRPEARGFEHAAIVCADSLAADVGLRVLRQGGNAVDCAVAVGFALAVTYPEAGNIGGGGFMLLRTAGGTSTVIDFRETAPMAADRDMFLDKRKNPIPEASLKGPLSAGIPGTVSGLLLALSRFGTMGRAEIINDAVRLAEEGFAVSERLSQSLEEQTRALRESPSASRTFLRGDEPLRRGDTLRQRDLARTLRLISEQGEAGFYDGEVAQLIELAMEPGGGIITKADLSHYHAVERKALEGSYRGYTVITIPPPSAGGIILLQMLNTLELFDLSKFPAGSARSIHLFASSAQLAFADRFRFAADPDERIIPVDALISKSYGLRRAERIRQNPTLRGTSVQPGNPTVDPRGETTHYSVIDCQGNIASVTLSLNDAYGGKVYVRGAGFFLNNVMDDFVVKPGISNFYGLTGGEGNTIAPGRRMVSSMAPAILLRDEQPVLILGARGGSRIPTSIVQVIMNVVDYGMDVREAVALRRVHHQWDPDILYYEKGFSGTAVLDSLEAIGYRVGELTSSPGRVQALSVQGGLLFGSPDPREGGAALGY